LIEVDIYLGHCLEKIPEMISEALELCNRYENRNLQSSVYFKFGCYFLLTEEYEKAYDNLQKVIGLTESTELAYVFYLRILGDVCLEIDRVDEAEKSYMNSLAVFLQKGMDEYVYWVKIAQLKLLLRRGETQKALEELEKLLPIPQKHVGYIKNNFFLLQDYLTSYKVFKANNDGRADDTLRMAYQILTERAEMIEDEEIRKSYLENIPWNREIIRLWEESIPDIVVY
jgi:tetratricopeptide (TPR) repeat protein